MVRSLLEPGDVDLNLKCRHGRILLWRTAYGGDVVVVSLLLQWDDVDLDFKNLFSQTPLSVAARNRHGAVTTLLLDHETRS